MEQENPYRYMLTSSIKHSGNANEGNYIVQVRYRPEDDVWYELQDLHVTRVLPQQVAISESYILIYEQLPPSEEEINEPHGVVENERAFDHVPLVSHQNGHADQDNPHIQEENDYTNRGLADGEERIET